MRHLFELNLPLIYFIYGLSFFIPGFIIIFQSLKLSKAGLVKNIKYLGLFFLLHGLADWGPLFYPFQSKIYSTQVLGYFEAFHLVLVTLSFYFLMVYGLQMLSKNNNFKKGFLQTPNILLLFWIVVSIYLLNKGGLNYWHDNAYILVRYFMGLPGALLTSLALKQERQLVKNDYEKRVGNYLMITYITLAIYAILAGFIVPAGNFFPADRINEEAFFNAFRIPIQFFRMLCGIIAAYCMVIILDSMQAELNRKLDEAQKEAAVLEDRERISQDIHDGTMQALYGVGLRLQYVEALLKNYENDVVKEHLHYAIEKLNQSSKEIRSYITNLRPHFENAELVSEIKKIVRDFIAETNIPVRFDYEQVKDFTIKPEIITQLSFVIKESLNNIRKHAEASMVQLVIMIYDSKIELIIRDNGRGFECTDGECTEKVNTGFGLKNITKRVEDIHGTVNICSHKDAGTGISIIIPLEDK